jgi:hypothetical protein
MHDALSRRTAVSTDPANVNSTATRIAQAPLLTYLADHPQHHSRLQRARDRSRLDRVLAYIRDCTGMPKSWSSTIFRDDTAQIVENYAAQHPTLRLLRIPATAQGLRSPQWMPRASGTSCSPARLSIAHRGGGQTFAALRWSRPRHWLALASSNPDPAPGRCIGNCSTHLQFSLRVVLGSYHDIPSADSSLHTASRPSFFPSTSTLGIRS